MTYEVGVGCTKMHDVGYIVSVKPGLLMPDSEIRPGDQSLTTMENTGSLEWADQVLGRIDEGGRRDACQVLHRSP